MMLRLRKKRHGLRIGGCLYVALACVIACVLLLLNRAIVGSIFTWYMPEILAGEVRYKQVATLVMPVFMIALEYWLYDLLVDRLTGDFEDSEESSS